MQKLESILEEAARLTGGPRGADYGPPWEDYTKVAEMMNALFHKKLKKPFTCADVPRIMILIKLSRDVNKAKRDNPVDIAGYAWCLHECEEHLRDVAGMDKQPGAPVGEGAGISTPSPAGSTPAAPADGWAVAPIKDATRCTCDIPGWRATGPHGYVKNFDCALHHPPGAATLAATMG